MQPDLGPVRVAAPGGDLGDVGEQQRVEPIEGLERRAGPGAAAATAIPSHIAGATAGRASTLAGSDVVESDSKWKAISGAVASVAATVTATPSARARRQPPESQPRSSASRRGAAQHEDPEHGGEAELPADVGGASD